MGPQARWPFVQVAPEERFRSARARSSRRARARRVERDLRRALPRQLRAGARHPGDRPRPHGGVGQRAHSPRERRGSSGGPGRRGRSRAQLGERADRRDHRGTPRASAVASTPEPSIQRYGSAITRARANTAGTSASGTKRRSQLIRRPRRAPRALAQRLDRHARAADDVERTSGTRCGDRGQRLDQDVEALVRPDQAEEEDARLGRLAARRGARVRRAAARAGSPRCARA